MPSSLLDQYRYTISDIQLLDPPYIKSIFNKYKPEFSIEIANVTYNGNKLLKSSKGISDKTRVTWDEQILSDVTADSTINFKVLRKTRRGKLEAIGEYTNTVSGLLGIQESSGVFETNLGEKGQLSFSVKKDRFKDILDKAKHPNKVIHFEEGESWFKFLAYFEIVKKATDPIAELNPYVQQAWSVLSAIPGNIQTHFIRNNSLNKLLQCMVDVYGYIIDADRLPSLTTTQSKNLKILIQQTWECSYYIKEYADKDIVWKLRDGSSVDNKVSKFKEVFDRLFDAIQKSITLEMDIVTLRVSKSVDETKDSHRLGEMPYAQNAGFIDSKKCLPGTRQKLIDEVLEWVNKDTPQRVFVLSGQAGIGKSAVAHTIAKFYQTQNRLGSFSCFSRSDQNRRNLLFSTISRDLADGDVSWRQGLVRAIEPTAIRKSLDPVTQFNEMIIKPSRDIETTGPVVIIIDALDENVDRDGRQTFLKLLFERSSELPGNYRLIITSRPEPDIELCYRHPNVFCKHMAHVDPVDTQNDIKQFVSSELSAVAETLDATERNWRLLLAEKAQGLFQWANLACLYIDPTVRFGLEGRLRKVISKSTSSLYELYHQILDARPEFRDSSYFSAFQTIIGAIIISRRPLSITVLQALFEPTIEDVQAVLYPCRTLFIGADSSTAEIRPIHTSLFDFFLSPEQKPGTPNLYYIDTLDQSSFTFACLRVMNTMLRFNICDLETSHLRNEDIPNFHSRVAKAVPPHLSYACCFWAYHLKYSQLNPDLLKEIHDLMDSRLMYLFEVLSLLGEVEHGRVGMRILENQVKYRDPSLAAQAADAWRLGHAFGDIMTESTPHLYLSVLPFTPKHSLVYMQYISQYPRLLNVEGSPYLDQGDVLERHPWAKSLLPGLSSKSPKDRQIAFKRLGEDNVDQTSQLFRARIRQVWFKGQCLLVGFNIFGDEYLQIWDITERNSRSDTRIGQGKSELIRISPQSNNWSIAYIGSSGALCIWNIVKGNEIVLDESGREITKLAFSATGDRLIGLDSKENIKIWDVGTHQLISSGKASVPNMRRADAFAFSPTGDTYFVAYSTSDKKVFIGVEGQEHESLKIVQGPFESTLFSPILSIAVAPNNTHVCAYSFDYGTPNGFVCYLELLDISTGTSRRLNAYQVPKFSSDRQYMAWIPKEDRTKVELWDLEKAVPLKVLSADSLGTPFVFDFSDDSERIAVMSFAHDTNHVAIWDIKTVGMTSIQIPNILSTRLYHILLQDSNLLVHDNDIGRIWSLRVHGIMAPLYAHHAENSQFGMLPRSLDNPETNQLIKDKLSSRDAEALRYALVAWKKATFSPLARIDEHGWVIGPHGELLFWVPERMRENLWIPCTTYAIDKAFTRLNFDNFVHGTSWTECRMQPNL